MKAFLVPISALLLVSCGDNPVPAGSTQMDGTPDAGRVVDDDDTGTPDATPDPEPAPTPDPTPDPMPAPTPDPTPDPEPQPDPTPDPEPAPEPEMGMLDPPEVPEYSLGNCPELVGGPDEASSVVQGFETGDQARDFRLIVPPSYDGSEPWPVMFAWHWLNASSRSFIREGELETAAEQMGFIIVLPDKLKNDNGDKAFLFDWPFAETWGIEGELTFFDDLLACVTAQFNVDLRRIYGIGVSAGGLWVSHLSTTDRVNHFAAIESLSGGLGELLGVWRMEWAPQPHKFPAIVLWGGDGDWLGLSFSEASQRYSNALINDGHFVLECVHDSGHGVPPIEAPDNLTRFMSLWQFMLDHPYGTPPGTSPYLDTGLPDIFPDWCRIP